MWVISRTKREKPSSKRCSGRSAPWIPCASCAIWPRDAHAGSHSSKWQATTTHSARSMKPGFAGIDNELYTADNTLMLFGDAKQVIGELAKAVSGEQGMGH